MTATFAAHEEKRNVKRERVVVVVVVVLMAVVVVLVVVVLVVVLSCEMLENLSKIVGNLKPQGSNLKASLPSLHCLKSKEVKAVVPVVRCTRDMVVRWCR